MYQMQQLIHKARVYWLLSFLTIFLPWSITCW